MAFQRLQNLFSCNRGKQYCKLLTRSFINYVMRGLFCNPSAILFCSANLFEYSALAIIKKRWPQHIPKSRYSIPMTNIIHDEHSMKSKGVLSKEKSLKVDFGLMLFSLLCNNTSKCLYPCKIAAKRHIKISRRLTFNGHQCYECIEVPSRDEIPKQGAVPQRAPTF